MPRLLRGMTVHELVFWDGLSRADAEVEMNNRVFGVGHAVDPKTGRPVENGIGSAQQQTKQHLDHLAKQRERQALIDAATRVTVAGSRTDR